LLYFVAYYKEAITGLARPFIGLALPFVGLNLVAHVLCRRERKAVGVAFYLGAAVLLPVFLLIAFQEAGLWPADPENSRELFGVGFSSNRQLQVAGLLACAWAFRLAFNTRTVALSACSTVLLLGFNFAVLADLDLFGWFERGRYDLLAMHLVPCFLLIAASAYMSDLRQRTWLARPLYFAGVVLFVTILELLALQGKAFEHLGLSMVAFRPLEISDPALLETVTAMTLNGLTIYVSGWLLDNRGTLLMKSAAKLLFVISPFAVLEPLAYLNKVGEYSRRFDWLYLALALGITFASRFRQRKSFYYAGLMNTAAALWFITDHYEWFDQPAWATVVVAVGVAALVAGFSLDLKERRRHVT
jgi:hypothetical protein